jgi:hypothetical protein
MSQDEVDEDMQEEHKAGSQGKPRSLKRQQRNKNGLWKSSWLFPSDPTERGTSQKNMLCILAAQNAAQFICCGRDYCDSHQCLSCLQAPQILLYRHGLTLNAWEGFGENSKVRFLASKLQPLWNKNVVDFRGKIQIEIPGLGYIMLCCTAMAVLAGTTQSSWQRVKKFMVTGETVVPKISSFETEQLGTTLLRTYISEVIARGAEQNPAPGASMPEGEAVVHKQPWRHRRNDAILWFKDAEHSKFPGQFPGMNAFKRLWKAEQRLKEKQACSHSKCQKCFEIDSELEKLRGLTTEGAKARRKDLLELRQLHDKFQRGERQEFDKACLTAIKYPRDMWTMIVDGATQRNFGALFL